MVIVAALWLFQAMQWIFLTINSDFTGFLGSDWSEIERFLPTYYMYPALPMTFALKAAPRIQMILAWGLLLLFYGASFYS
jgi:hypothetical protein